MSEASSTKRKRSAIACTVCHDRKVRCNVAINGVPCSNCLQDGTVCRVYGRRPSVGPERAIRPRLATTDDAPNPRTPSTVVSSIATGLHNDLQSMHTPSNGVVTRAEPTPQTDSHVNDISARHASPVYSEAPLVPYHAGVSEGLDFLFDICHPTRPFKGDIYIINRQRSRFPTSDIVKNLTSKPLPPSSTCQELLRLYFHYVHAFLPVINAADFLKTYSADPSKTSPLLLWSVFFAAGSFMNADRIRETGFQDRKALKLYFYSHAKALYDAQVETDKTTIIQATLLLGYYYIDLEDLDGSWHWIAVATSLCHGIGLHRDARWHRLQRSPFQPGQFEVWRRIWWGCYCREAWLALGLGRPMRIHSDDMDTPMPTTSDIIDELERLSPELRQAYIPTEMTTLANLWINYLQLTEKVENVLKLNYRPKRQPVTRTILEHYDTEIWQLYEQVYDIQGQSTRLQMLHTHLLRTYYNSVIIALFRPYIVNAPEALSKTEQETIRSLSLDRCRASSSNSTYSLNELVSSDLIEVCPTMLMISMMSAMQIHFYEHFHLEGLSRQHALHNLKLHIMVLDHLRKTYWTADMQHKLFIEALKAMETPAKCQPTQRSSSKETEPTSAHSIEQPQSEQDMPMMSHGSLDGAGHVNEYDLNDPNALGSGTEALDDFFVSFNPFNTSLNPFNDWMLGNGTMQ